MWLQQKWPGKAYQPTAPQSYLKPTQTQWRFRPHRYPKAEQVGDLLGITTDTIEQLIKKHRCDLVFLSGGTPCKQLSRAAHDQSGLDGKDSKLFWAFSDSDPERLRSSQKGAHLLFLSLGNVPMEELWLKQV